MITKEGKELKTEIEKVKEFEFLNKTLYQTTQPSKGEMREFLEWLEIEKITEPQLIIMEEPMREEELILAITRMKNNTAPGLDGFTTEFYFF